MIIVLYRNILRIQKQLISFPVTSLVITTLMYFLHIEPLVWIVVGVVVALLN